LFTLKGASPPRELEIPLYPGEENMERMILDSDLKLPKPWIGFGVRDLGVRVWGDGSSGEGGSWCGEE